MVRILIPGSNSDQLTIQPSNSKILGFRATWLLHKRVEQSDRIGIRQYPTGLYDCLLGNPTLASYSVNV